MVELQSKKEKIQDLGLDKIQEFFKLSKKDVGGLKPDILKHLYNMARLGMQFEKEMNISKRATENNYLRIGQIITENKGELKKYIEKTMPSYQK